MRRSSFNSIRKFDKWESLCKGCGICCYEKRRNHRTGRFYTDYKSPCEFLDEKTKRCTVYEERFAVCKNCKKMTVMHALFADFLPPSCGYVEHFRFWKKWGRRAE